MSERQGIQIVQIGLVSDSAADNGSVMAKGWFRKLKSVNIKKSKADLKSDKFEESKADLKPNNVVESKADLRPNNVVESKADLKPDKVEESKADLKPDKVEESKVDLKTDKVEESKADLKPDKVEESKVDLKTDRVEESEADLKPDEIKESKADLKTVKFEKGKADLNPKKVKESNAELNDKMADNKKSDHKKDGLLTRARQWFTLRKAQRVSTRKEKKAAKKAAKKAREQEAQATKPEEEMWAEILKLESEFSSLKDDHEVTEAERRYLMVPNVRKTRYLEKMKKDRVHAAILEKELAKVLWARIDMDEKTMSLKQRSQLKMAKMSSKPKMVSAGTQTDGPCTEELYGNFLAYKDKVSKMKTEIVAQTDELEQLEREAEIRRKAENDLIAQTNNDIKKLQIKLEQLMN